MFQSGVFSKIILRSSNALNFATPIPNIDLLKKSMAYSGIFLLNTIPVEIRMINTIMEFTAKCERWLRI